MALHQPGCFTAWLYMVGSICMETKVEKAINDGENFDNQESFPKSKDYQ
jgi:hypothetical protein